VVACPECGQCLAAPAAWSPSVSDVLTFAPHSVTVQAPPKFSGWVGVGLGSFLAAIVWAIPDVDVVGAMALVFLGGALAVEGAGRLWADVRRRQGPRRAVVLELSQETSLEGEDLGRLQAVYQTRNSWGDSLAILLLGFAVTAGELFLLDWLRQGALSAKLLLAALVPPFLALYLFYRAARNLVERRRVLIFTHGLVCLHGRRIDVHRWETVHAVSYLEIGDAIDEQAVVIHLKYGKPALRFTRCHFQNLHRLHARIQHGLCRRSPADPDDD
jgi:hypothetical protein